MARSKIILPLNNLRVIGQPVKPPTPEEIRNTLLQEIVNNLDEINKTLKAKVESNTK